MVEKYKSCSYKNWPCSASHLSCAGWVVEWLMVLITDNYDCNNIMHYFWYSSDIYRKYVVIALKTKQ